MQIRLDELSWPGVRGAKKNSRPMAQSLKCILMLFIDLTWDEQSRRIANWSGFLGASRDYLAGIVERFAHLGIIDEHCAELWREADANRQAQSQPDPAR